MTSGEFEVENQVTQPPPRVPELTDVEGRLPDKAPPYVCVWSSIPDPEGGIAIQVEALLLRGLAQLILTGLPDSWLRDSRDKIVTLIQQRAKWRPTQKILIHLLPADCTKHGSALELPIALACLAALQPDLVCKTKLQRYSFAGSLTLQGKLVSTLLRPGLVGEREQLGAEHFESLDDAWSFLTDESAKVPQPKDQPVEDSKPTWPVHCIGRRLERTMLMAAAVARLPVFLMGPPGVGKTHLVHWAAQQIPAPPLDQHNQIQSIWAAAHQNAPKRPLVHAMARAHLADFIGRNRGGLSRPGYFSLAHGGALIVDEFLELNRDARESFRNVLDTEKLIRPSQHRLQNWPASFWFLATSNPCPCGLSGLEDWARCHCRPQDRLQYRSKLSGPLADRFGVQLWISELDAKVPDLSAPDWIDDDTDSLQHRLAEARRQFTSHSKTSSLHFGPPNRRNSLRSKLLASLLALGIRDSDRWEAWAHNSRIQLREQLLN